eukprot:jgi/Orpsp1_1/1184028/evm.model.c7180000087718.1
MKQEEVGRMQDFYELGGNSLNAIRISSRIEKELKIKIYIKDIMSHSLIYDLSKYIESIMNDEKNENNKMEIISKQNSKEFPITSQQLGVYLDSIKEPNSIVYNIPNVYKLNENINKEKIKKSFLKIFDEQEILRSKYYGKEINGKIEIYGYIDDECTLKFEEYSYENIGGFIRPFDLSQAPLIRVGFIKNEYLLFDMHHIISDGSIIMIIMNELNKYYNDEDVEELEIQYSDYAIHLNEKKNNRELDSQISIYKEIFSNEYEILIKQHYLLVFMDMYYKYSGQDTIYTSMMSANRNNHYVEYMAGMFVSTLPLLLKYTNEENKFIEIIKENMEMLNNIYKNQDISFSELTEILKLKKMNNSFIFQPYISNESNENPNKSIFRISNCEDENMKLNLFNEIQNALDQNNKSKFEISFSVIENKNDYLISIEYDNSLYDSIMIKNMLNSYIEIMKNINNLENNNIKNIEYIPIKEKERIIKEFNSDVNKEGCDKLYHEEFNRIAEKYPENIAIVFNEIIITYNKLDKMSNSLVHYLCSQGIKRNDIIPIICDRSPYYIIGILGISKAGGAFLPVDKDLPYERIHFILEDVNPKLILYKNCEEVIDNLLMEENIKYNVYDLEKHNYSLNSGEINIINETDDICYVIFTSGTTGKPKGTIISHYNIYNYIRSNKEYNNKNNNIGYCNYDSIMREFNVKSSLAIYNFAFDASLIEIFIGLIHGLKIILLDDILIENVDLLSEYIIKNEVEFIQLTPSRLKLFIENNLFRISLKQIKTIGLGGEALSIELCKNINNISNCKIFNEYGPTECAVCCCFKEIRFNEDKLTIGRSICNKSVPIGVEGEIYIGGYGVGKGYLNRPELTKEKFIENPFNYDNDEHNRIMYRTGDLGKWTNEGEIEYLGRIDFQVKINGQRVELGEIESKILEIPEIQQCIVIDKMKDNGEKYLVCYYIIGKERKEISNKSIRKYLGKELPRYMVPNYYIRINEIPLNSTGKLNRRALPEPNKKNFITEAYVASESDIEKVICKIFGEVFNIPGIKIGRMHDFYELGGDSLNAIRISSRIEKELKIKIYIKDIMSHSKISDLSEYIESIIKDDKNENNKMEIISNSTGKLNRRGLPEPKEKDFITETYVAPVNNIEKVICKIYDDVFNIPGIKIGRMHDFYELGGNSFNAIKIIGRIRNILKINLTIKDIMKNSKVYLLSNMCNEIMNQNELKYNIELIENTNKDEFPISYLFNNIFYYINQNDILESDKISKDNIIIYYRILKDLNIEKLNYAFNVIINRHKVLKTNFIEKIEDGRKRIYGKIKDEMILNIVNYKEINNKVDTTKENLIRVGIIENKILVIKISHIICDGYSYGILINELIDIYNDKILDELPYQFSDYAIYFDKKLKSKDAFIDQIQYYKSIFDCQFDILRLPQKVSNESKKVKMKKVNQIFNNEIYTNVKKLIKDENISETTYFLIVICLVLSIYSKQKNILTCVSSSSRNNYNTEKLIGMFVSKIPILVKFENMNLIDLIRKYKNILLTILSYDVPIKRLMEELNINSINMRFQYNPYDLYVNNENNSSKFLKDINNNKISTILSESENNNTLLDKDKDNDSSNKYDEYNIDLDILVSEMESSYNLDIAFNECLFEDNLVQDIINDILLIIKDKNYLNKNINSIIDSTVNKPVNM